MSEKNESTKKYLLYTLSCFETLLHSAEYEKAYGELQKIIDIICSTYQPDAHAPLIACIQQKDASEKSCRFALNAIFEIYTEVIKAPVKQYQADTKTLTFEVQPVWE